jgi:hypothetical protein
MKHLHHIIPSHLGGTDDPSNLTELTIAEHAEAHRILYEQHGHWQDYVAWQGLLGLNEHFDAAKESMKAGGREGAKKTNSKWSDPEYKATRLEKWRPTMIGVWDRMKGVRGSANPTAKEYQVTYPDGRIENVKSLKAWCEDNGLKYNTVFNMCLGKNKSHRGYSIKKI